MSAKTWVQDVVPGYGEYLTKAFSVGAANDYVEFEFNSPITVEEIIVESSGTSSDQYDLSVIYPTTETETFIIEAQLGDTNYYLNQTLASKRWIRIPARGKLRVTCSTYSAAFNLTLFALGRA